MKYKQEAPFDQWYESLLKLLNPEDPKEKENWIVLYELGFSETEAVNIGTAQII